MKKVVIGAIFTFFLFQMCASKQSEKTGIGQNESHLSDTVYYIGVTNSRVIPFDKDTTIVDTMRVIRMQSDTIRFRIKDLRYDILDKTYDIFYLNAKFKINDSNIYEINLPNPHDEWIHHYEIFSTDSIYYYKKETSNNKELMRICEFVGRKMKPNTR